MEATIYLGERLQDIGNHLGIVAVPFAHLLNYNSLMVSVVNINPNILGGTPVFAGTRVPVESLFDCSSTVPNGQAKANRKVA